MASSSDHLPLKKTLLVIAITLSFALIFFLYIQSTFHLLRIHGESMMPGLENGDILLAVSKRSLSRFDMIVFRDPANPSSYLIKRLVAFPGEALRFQEGQLYINEHPYPWPGSKNGKTLQPDMTLHTPDNSCFVLGDNPFSSRDSRQLGPIPLNLVWAQVLLRIWPPKFLHSRS